MYMYFVSRFFFCGEVRNRGIVEFMIIDESLGAL